MKIDQPLLARLTVTACPAAWSATSAIEDGPTRFDGIGLSVICRFLYGEAADRARKIEELRSSVEDESYLVDSELLARTIAGWAFPC
jgi:hypothetical protein